MHNEKMIIGGLAVEIIRKKKPEKPVYPDQSAGRKCNCKHTN